MKSVRYRGEFVSRAGVTWRVELLEESETGFLEVGELEFPSKSPLVIEWQREDKEVVLCGSSATLKLISPSDRYYEDLYSIEVGHIRMDVYRSGELYWSGALDTEFYEEPYESESGYEVSLTFSDFGILDRFKYGLSGMKTLRDIVEYSLSQSTILYRSINTDYISTTFDDGSAIANGALSVRSDNFFDEDGEASTLYEVLEGILQPLAIKMVQRGGVIYLYDINGLYLNGDQKEITWDGDSQMMGVDKVANNVVVSFSPYSNSELMSPDVIEYTADYDIAHVNLTNADPVVQGNYGMYHSYYPDYSDEHRAGSDWDYNLIDFTIFSKYNGGKGLADAEYPYFHILPVTGGASEVSGIAYSYYSGGHGGLDTNWPIRKITDTISLGNQFPLFKTNRVFLPYINEEDAKKYKIRVVEEVLIDCRYNPFSGSTSGNEEGNDKSLKIRAGFVFIPAYIRLLDEYGDVIYHYSNIEAAAGAKVGHLGYSTSRWVEGDYTDLDCWLEYYNGDNLKDEAGVRGWKGNRHCIGRPDGAGGRAKTKIFDSFIKMGDGEYIPYPPASGYLEITINVGLRGYDYGESCAFGAESGSVWHNRTLYDRLRWVLYKAPKVEVVNNNLIFDEAELSDVEYSGYLNASAKEEISLDTICGTALQVCPTARGVYHITSTGEQLSTLTRNGVSDHPERLLIGTLYSQYATRRTTLSGEATIHAGLHRFNERNQGDKVFMLLSDVQDVITDCTEAEYCEIMSDEYEGIDG